MGLLVLAFALVAALSACEPMPQTARGPDEAAGEMAHAELACQACHNGAPVPGREAAVPASSCGAGGCHEQGGPESVEIATVTFPHRGHGGDGTIDPTCAGCHAHRSGDAPLEASVDACALCHVGEVSGGRTQECRLCHVSPDHARLTSQGVAVAHSELPWTEIGCVRCHYDVAAAETDVPAAGCRQCHEDLAALNRAAVGRDLHPIHGGLNCTSCHAADGHQVRAMSSAVDLVCSDCHGSAHDVSLSRAAPDPVMCSSCHTAVHAPQQRLLLGVRPDGGVTPSTKFLAGITCRSCHVPPGTPGGTVSPIRGQAASCAGCHDQRYAQVLDWWIEGLRSRVAATRSYLDRADRALSGRAEAGEPLSQARGMVDLVAEAGGQHNLELSDRLLREAVASIRGAYRAAGSPAPASPDLGRAPHSGLCSYCHYRPNEPWNFEAMPEDFHDTVLSRQE